MSRLAAMLHGSPPVRELRRAVSWHRRLLAAGLAAAAMAFGLAAVDPQLPETVIVQSAEHDLRAGTRLAASDLRALPYPADSVPSGAVTKASALVGRVLAAPAREGEPFTDVRVLGPDLLAAYGKDVVAAPVRPADPGELALVRVGSTVDVLAAESANPGSPEGLPEVRARPVAKAVRVIALPSPAGETAGEPAGGVLGDVAAVPAGDEGLVVLAVPPAVAAELAEAAVTSRLSLVLRG